MEIYRPYRDEPVYKPRISRDAIEHLRGVYQRGLDHRRRFDPIYKAAAGQFNPTMAEWDADPNDITFFDPSELHDNTGWRVSKNLADAMQGYSFGRQIPWFRYGLDDADLTKSDEEAAQWLQWVEDRTYSILARCNFYDEGWLNIRSAADFGTGIMLRNVNKQRQLPSYSTLKLARTVIFENEYNEVDVLFLDVWLTPHQAAGLFGKKTLPTIVQDAYDNGDTKLFQFVHLICPWDKFAIDMQRKAGKPWTSLWVCPSGGDEAWEAVRHFGFDSRPFWAWRWSRNMDGSPLGIDNPGMMEVSTMKQLQGMRKDYHRIVQQTARPPIKASKGLENKINFIPNGVTYLGAGQDFAATVTTGNPQLILQDSSILQSEVKESYYIKLFLALTQSLESKKTATEVEQIRAEQSALLTAVSGRMNTEFLECAVEDVFNIEKDAGRLPPPPRSLQGKEIKIHMISPLASLQKKYLRLDTTQQAVATVLALAQVDPTVLDEYDLGKYARLIGEIQNVDRTVLRDLADVERIRQGRAKLQAQQMAVQQQEMQARAVGKMYGAMSKAPEEGSPVASMAG